MIDTWIPCLFVAAAAIFLGYIIGSYRGYQRGMNDAKRIFGKDDLK